MLVNKRDAQLLYLRPTR